jgi:hypothetical protein
MNKIEQLKIDIANKETESQKLANLIAPLENSYRKLLDAKKKLQEELDNILIKNMHKPNWNWILEETGHTGNARHKQAGIELEKIGLSSMGYYREINQRAIKIALIKGDPKSHS